MGQAKLRGTREERIEQAVERERIERAEREVAYAERRKQAQLQRAARHQLALSPGSPSGAVKNSFRSAAERGAMRAALLTGAALGLALAEPTKRRG